VRVSATDAPSTELPFELSAARGSRESRAFASDQEVPQCPNHLPRGPPLRMIRPNQGLLRVLQDPVAHRPAPSTPRRPRRPVPIRRRRPARLRRIRANRDRSRASRLPPPVRATRRRHPRARRPDISNHRRAISRAHHPATSRVHRPATKVSPAPPRADIHHRPPATARPPATRRSRARAVRRPGTDNSHPRGTARRRALRAVMDHRPRRVPTGNRPGRIPRRVGRRRNRRSTCPRSPSPGGG